MKATKMTIQVIQNKIYDFETLIFKKQGLIEVCEKNGEDTSQLQREIEDLVQKILFAKNEIKRYEV